MQPLSFLLSALAGVLGALAAGHALLHKRRPQSALGWIAVSLTLPFVGAALYYLFGINRVETRARMLRGAARRKSAPAPSEGEFPLLDGNAVEPLHNGEEAYPSMLDAIRRAHRHVYLSSYIFGTTSVGGEFIAALGEAARRGVDVRVLVDGVGELYTWPRAGPLLRRQGVRIERFLPPRLVPPALHVNLRNHRKILVADGQIGYTGGMNVAARHLVADPSRSHRVVDIHFRFQGPVVSQLERTFAADWYFVTGEVVGSSPPPRIERAGESRCRVVADGPDENRDPLIALLLRSIASAEHRVAIMTPYFLPSPELVGVLQAAALRGIDVEVMLPARNNLPYVHWATRHMLWQLLLYGVRIYYQPPPFVHSKFLLIDDARAVVGSWNVDPRSLRLNFELAVEIRGGAVLSELSSHLTAVRARSTSVTLDEVDGRGLAARLRDGVAWLLSPYL